MPQLSLGAQALGLLLHFYKRIESIKLSDPGGFPDPHGRPPSSDREHLGPIQPTAKPMPPVSILLIEQWTVTIVSTFIRGRYPGMLKESWRKLLKLDVKTVYPAHGGPFRGFCHGA